MPSLTRQPSTVLLKTKTRRGIGSTATKAWSGCTLLLFLLILNKRDNTFSNAHISHGLHGLSSVDHAIGNPALPAIEGAFEVELNARFTNVTAGVIHDVFEYSTVAHSDTIFFGVLTSSTGTTLHLNVHVSGTNYSCSTSMMPALVEGDLHRYKFGVDSSDNAFLVQDGIPQTTCSDIPAPLNVARNHFLGTGTLVGVDGIERMYGAVLGLRVTNLGQPQHPRDALALHNIPGQSFASSFVASFYARFDHIARGREFQIAFDISRGRSDNNIQCGQFKGLGDFYCEVFPGAGGPPVRIFANGSIVEGEFAFWHFGVTVNGTASAMWIDKNGVRLIDKVADLPVPNVFRKMALFGATSFEADELDGVVLGFRLDRAITS